MPKLVQIVFATLPTGGFYLIGLDADGGLWNGRNPDLDTVTWTPVSQIVIDPK